MKDIYNLSFRLLLLFFLLFLLQDSIFAQEDGEDIIIGKYRKFNSKILGGEITYLEYLPFGYDKNNRKYPVIIQMGSSGKYNFANAVSALNHLSFERIPNMILIGISTTGPARNYWPCPDEGKEEPDAANEFIKFIEEELIPYIDQQYRTQDYRVFAGGSNAGLFTIYTFLHNPDLFNAYIAISPMLGWCTDFIYQKAEDLFNERESLNKFLYIPYGGSDYKEYVNSQMSDFVKILESRAPKDLIWKVNLMEHEVHVPFAGMNDGLLALFPDYMIPEEVKIQGIDEVDKYYQKLTKKHGFFIEPPSEVLFDMAFQQKRKKEYEKSIVIFKELIKRSPNSARAHNFLGETYEDMGDTTLAIESYQNTLKIDPDYGRAKRNLEKINTK